MEEQFITLTLDTLEQEHLCCAISDKKHQPGVLQKKAWLRDRIAEGHVFRKLDTKGKVLIEYAPVETAWVPVAGENYLYIYCLWVAGSYKGKGYGKSLLLSCIDDARRQGKSGVCILSSKKKQPYLSDKRFLMQFGFQVADTAGSYELLALRFDETCLPQFTPTVKKLAIDSTDLCIYYSAQCPFTLDCVRQVQGYCERHAIPLRLCPVDTLEKAKQVPCVFQCWAVFYQGVFQTTQLMNEGLLEKFLSKLD